MKSAVKPTVSSSSGGGCDGKQSGGKPFPGGGNHGKPATHSPPPGTCHADSHWRTTILTYGGGVGGCIEQQAQQVTP